MIKKIYRSELDLFNLSLKRTSIIPKNKKLNYKKIVVDKPWGYEYLMFENDILGIWILYLKQGFSTSMHCHLRKKTSLTLLSGKAISSTLDTRFKLKSLDGLIIDSGVFHSTEAISPDGIFLMEIETPPDKDDLIRLRDKYGRENKAYEDISQMSTNLRKYEYCDFHNHFINKSGQLVHKKLRDRNIKIKHHPNFDDFKNYIAEINNGLVCFLDDNLAKINNSIKDDFGEIRGIKELVKKIGKETYVGRDFLTLIIH